MRTAAGYRLEPAFRRLINVHSVDIVLTVQPSAAVSLRRLEPNWMHL